MDQNKRTTDRKSISLLVQLKHSDVGTFAEEYAVNLSPGGMFIRSRQPQPIGTRLRFEVQIAGGVRVMRGTAVVRWVRLTNDPAGAPGMGLQFLELDEYTRALVDKMLERKKAAEPASDLNASPGVAKPLAAMPSVAPVSQGGWAAPPPAFVPPPSPVDEPLSDEDDPFTAKTVPGSIGDGPIDPMDMLNVPVSAPPTSDASDLDDVDISISDLVASTPEPPDELLPGKLLPDEPPAPPPFEIDIETFASAAPPPAPKAAPAPAAKAAPAPAPVTKAAPAPAPKPEPAPPPTPFFEPPPPPEPPPAPPPKRGIVELELDPGDGSSLQLQGEKPGRGRMAPTPTPAKPAAPISPPPPANRGPVELELDPGDGSSLQLEGEKPGRGRAAAMPTPVKPAAPVAAPSSNRGPVELELDPGDGDALQLEGENPGRARPAPKAPARTPAAGSPPATAPTGDAARARPTSVPTPGAPQSPVVAPPAAKPPPPAPPPPPKEKTPPLVFLKPPTEIAGIGVVIGIDLGTTNSCVAVLNKDNRPTVLRSKDGYNTVPSVVSLNQKDQLLVSHRAKSQMLLNATNTIYGAKRLVGRPFDSATVRQVRERFHYEVVSDVVGNAAVRLKDYVLSLEEVQGIILRECKEMAEQQLGQRVERAVITVPAYYSEPQREAVRKAGALAGLKVERILNEPTAAALAYGLNRELTKKVLVYDLGGGTFDATLLRIEKNVFEVIATGGDIFLGGIDFDNQIVDALLQKFEQQHGLPFSGDNGALSRVTDAAERAKVALSERQSTEVELPMLMMDAEMRPRDLRCSFTRAELNEVCGTLVTRTLDVVRDVLLDAKIKATEIDDIILVGGMSRMPLVRERLKELFGKAPHASVNADEAVAIGAALYSGSIDKVSNVTLIDVLPMTLGVGLPGGAFRRVIERNTPLPAQTSFTLTTTRDNEQMLEISLFQGEDTHVAGNEYLGTVRVEDLPKGPKGLVKVAITVRLDTECVLHVEARDMGTRRILKATIANRYTAEELEKQLNYGKDQVRAAELKREQDLKERGGKFWGFLKRVIGRK